MGVDVDFQRKTALVTMEPGRTLSRAQCEGAFAGTRYSVLAFEARTGTAATKPGD